MTAFAWLKLLHMSCAVLSIGGFALRGHWLLSGSPLLSRRPTRVLPHLVDTLLLGSALGMLWIWRLDPFRAPWLTAKIVALLVYIGLGLTAFRFADTVRGRRLALLLALCTAAYIVAVAFSKSAWGPLQALFVGH
jgi:uncharacterized membrane protein SirB2